MQILFKIFSASALPDPRLGVGFTALAIVLFSVLNGVVKELSDTFPINQVVFFRNFFALVPLFVLALSSSGKPLSHVGRPGLQIILAAVFTAYIILSFKAFTLMPLADATAIGFLQPLIVIVLARLWGREKPRPIEWLVVIAGLLGVGLMIDPSGQSNKLGAAVALGGAAFSALGMILQRELSSSISSLSITFYMLLTSSILIAPTLAVSWEQPSTSQAAWLIGLGLASGFCQLLIVRALYHAPASIIAPISYSKMLWAILIGVIWFGDIPSLRVIIGTGVILLTSMLAFKIAFNSENQ